MNRKTLTSANGDLLQITLSPFEQKVLLSLTSTANLPQITSRLNSANGGNYADVRVVGTVIRNFFNLLEK